MFSLWSKLGDSDMKGHKKRLCGARSQGHAILRPATCMLALAQDTWPKVLPTALRACRCMERLL